ncbi:hypothetical protein BDW74DRAFT_126193 [Aspergillus multicolor]|uniref:uncharacterized protein n=1 Tax=Aspergillus multicolor TaxID=41759 RepID=UPI003CCCF42C
MHSASQDVEPNSGVNLEQWVLWPESQQIQLPVPETLDPLLQVDEVALWPRETFPRLDFPTHAPEPQESIVPAPFLPPTSTQDLASLSVALSSLAERLPSLPARSTGTRSATREHRDADADAMPFVLDDLFHLTTQLTDLVQCLCAPADKATTLMLASCHVRLTDMYENILSMIQRCIQHSLGPPRPRPNWAVVLPEVKMGSSLLSPVLLVCESSSVARAGGKTLMYICMIVTFSGDVWTKLADAVRRQHHLQLLAEMRSGSPAL